MVEFDRAIYYKMQSAFKGEADDHAFLSKQLTSLEEKEKRVEALYTHTLEAREIVQQTVQETVSNLEVHLSSLGTMALSSVSDQWPEFSAEVRIGRNTMELHLMFKEFGVLQKPKDSSGFGPCDVADYAMQVGFWCLDKNRPVLVLDEPFRNVSPDLQHKVSQMITKINEEIKIQHIMISHAKNINTAADRTFLVEKRGKKSYLTIERE